MNNVRKFFERLLGGDLNAQALKGLWPMVKQVNSWEEKIALLSDDELKAKTEEFKARLTKGETLDDLLPEAFAVAREASKRVLGMRPFDTQVMGGIVLHQGKISEMKTGEGKTLVATMPVYLNALTGKGVHVVTVNDYLAKRDSEWMGQVYKFLGLTVGVVVPDMSAFDKKNAYNSDITYGTNNEFGFDYLRDNMSGSEEGLAQRELNFAIVDEVDSILIDEARTPLIISAPDEESTQHYKQFAGIVPKLTKGEDYTSDDKTRSVTITESGIEKIEELLGIKDIYESGDVTLAHHIEQALKAHDQYHLDRDYVVKDGEIIIVDEFTGRLMIGRRYSEGLHQAIEAKEGVEVKQESKTLATITFQNFFRLYDKLSGMTGTAKTEEEEFYRIYGLPVIEVPTNQPMIRKDLNDLIYVSEEAKFKAVVQEIRRRYETGQPVLVGTIAIEKSELLSNMLKSEGVPHQVLNAKQHEREAEIIANAGQKQSVTIATNMAGRGTDIKLGEGVVELGGLHILGTERHESRRIDNQLRGRAGRQGDPGSSQFYVSLEDDLMRLFGSERLKGMMKNAGIGTDLPLEHPWVSNSIEGAQKKVEGYNFDIRKRVLEYDDVMNRHRTVIYELRRKILAKENVKEKALEYIHTAINNWTQTVTALPNKDDWRIEDLIKVIEGVFSLRDEDKEKMLATYDKQEVADILMEIADKHYAKREEELGEDTMREVERAVLLRVIDMLWMEHIDAMMRLRESIGLRGYAQRDPLSEYKQEAYDMYQRLLTAAAEDFARLIYRVQITQAPKPAVQEGEAIMNNPQIEPGFKEEAREIKAEPGVLPWPRDIDPSKVGRNDPCPCGSGLKFKKCHGR